MKRRKRRRVGSGIGQGPTALEKLPPVQSIPLPPKLEEAKSQGRVEQDLRAFSLGKCTILLGQETGWHLSIAHPSRYPTWDEVAKARYELIPDEVTMAMLLPPRANYINVHEYCFQLWEVRRVQPESRQISA